MVVEEKGSMAEVVPHIIYIQRFFGRSGKRQICGQWRLQKTAVRRDHHRVLISCFGRGGGEDSGQKTVGRSPSSTVQVARHTVNLDADIERSAAAIQNLVQSSDITQLLSDIEMAQDDYNINAKDTHRADKKRKSQKKSKEKGAAKKKLKFF